MITGLGCPETPSPRDLPRTPMRALGTLQQWSEDSVRPSLGLVPGPCPKHHERSQGSTRSVDGADPRRPIDRTLASSLRPGPRARELAFLSGLCACPGKSQCSVCRCLVQKLYLPSVSRAGMNRCSVVEGGPRYRGTGPAYWSQRHDEWSACPRTCPTTAAGIRASRVHHASPSARWRASQGRERRVVLRGPSRLGRVARDTPSLCKLWEQASKTPQEAGPHPAPAPAWSGRVSPKAHIAGAGLSLSWARTCHITDTRELSGSPQQPPSRPHCPGEETEAQTGGRRRQILNPGSLARRAPRLWATRGPDGSPSLPSCRHALQRWSDSASKGRAPGKRGMDG